MERIDITMTAVLRPKCLKYTLKSFRSALFTERNRYRLIINIDPIGERIDPSIVVDICEEYFNDVLYNVAEEASFPKAIKWLWNNVETKYFFHLEDDWMFNKKTSVNIDDLIRVLNISDHFASVRLSKEKLRFAYGNIVNLNDGQYAYFYDNYFLPLWAGRSFTLNPAMIKRKFIEKALPLYSIEINPEKQFRYKNKVMQELVMSYTYALYGKPNDSPYTKDHGEKWREFYGYKKPEKNQFLTWDEQ